MATNDKPVVLPNDKQCTMSGCDNVAQPMAGATSNDVVKTQINNIYYTITIEMANSPNELHKNALSVSELLAKPLKPKN